MLSTLFLIFAFAVYCICGMDDLQGQHAGGPHLDTSPTFSSTTLRRRLAARLGNTLQNSFSLAEVSAMGLAAVTLLLVVLVRVCPSCFSASNSSDACGLDGGYGVGPV